MRARSISVALLGFLAVSPASAQTGPTVFQPGLFSTGAWDFFVALTPDQRTAYICRANGDFSYYTILETRLVNGRWSEPRTAPFSGRWSDADPHISPDGSRLFFHLQPAGHRKRGERRVPTSGWSNGPGLAAGDSRGISARR